MKPDRTSAGASAAARFTIVVIAAALSGCDWAPDPAPPAPEVAAAGTESAMASASAPAAAPTDAQIDARIRAAFKAALLDEPPDEGLKKAEVYVQTKDGVAVLTGQVRSQYDSDRAHHIVSNVEGVKAVDNRLTITMGRMG